MFLKKYFCFSVTQLITEISWLSICFRLNFDFYRRLFYISSVFTWNLQIFTLCRCPDKELVIYPADVVLFEGILVSIWFFLKLYFLKIYMWYFFKVFYFPAIRDLFHMKLFVDTDSDTRLSRRGMVSPFFL